jgi:hypothetical protein
MSAESPMARPSSSVSTGTVTGPLTFRSLSRSIGSPTIGS